MNEVLQVFGCSLINVILQVTDKLTILSRITIEIMQIKFISTHAKAHVPNHRTEPFQDSEVS